MALTHKELAHAVRMLHLSPNSIVAIRHGTAIAGMETVNALAGAIGEAGIRNVFVLVVDDPADLQTFDPAAMARAGWYRAETFGKVFARLGRKNGKT